jgi:hypothetical protein
VIAQIVGGAVAVVVIGFLYPDFTPEEAADAVLPSSIEQINHHTAGPKGSI